jgi:hypothetical protein
MRITFHGNSGDFVEYERVTFHGIHGSFDRIIRDFAMIY